MLYKKYLCRTKSKLNNITFVYSTIQLFILTLLFRPQKVGGNFRTGKEIIPKSSSWTFILCCVQLCSQRRLLLLLCCCCCSATSVVSDSMQPHRQQPTRLPGPWDSPGKNTGVGCHFLLQCMKVKSESEVTQSCPTLSDPIDCTLPGSSIHGIFQARLLEWGAIAFSTDLYSEEKRIENILASQCQHLST